ncbi:HesB/IscA family protein [Verrucomicrobiota bacterium sgz303538]
MISVTESAIKHLHTLVQEQGDGSKGLRIFVEKGGCAGLQYGMNLDNAREGDEVLEQQGVQVIIDPESLSYLRGSTLDYSDDLAGAGFRLKNPNAVRSCGCGTSFEPTGDSSHSH